MHGNSMLIIGNNTRLVGNSFTYTYANVDTSNLSFISMVTSAVVTPEEESTDSAQMLVKGNL